MVLSYRLTEDPQSQGKEKNMNEKITQLSARGDKRCKGIDGIQAQVKSKHPELAEELLNSGIKVKDLEVGRYLGPMG